jgi:hypothetical protein
MCRGHDQTPLSGHDDLHLRREPRGRSDLAVADRDEGAVHDPQSLDGVLGGAGRLECVRGPIRWITRHTLAGEKSNSGASRRMVRFVR